MRAQMQTSAFGLASLDMHQKHVPSMLIDSSACIINKYHFEKHVLLKFAFFPLCDRTIKNVAINQ